MSLPLDIDPGESILRSLRKRDVDRAAGRVKAGSLKPGSGGGTEVSLIRQRIGDDEAKFAAIEHVHKTEFWGFGTGQASAVSAHGTSLKDDREMFLGHANLDLGFDIPAGPPNTPPEMTEEYELGMKRLINLAAVFRVVEDTHRADNRWLDGSLTA